MTEALRGIRECGLPWPDAVGRRHGANVGEHQSGRGGVVDPAIKNDRDRCSKLKKRGDCRMAGALAAAKTHGQAPAGTPGLTPSRMLFGVDASAVIRGRR